MVLRVLIPWQALNLDCAFSCSEYYMRPCPQLLIQSLLLLGDALALADHELEASVVGIPRVATRRSRFSLITWLAAARLTYSGDSLCVDSLLH